MGPGGGVLVVGSPCFIASIFSMKNETVIGRKDQEGRGVNVLEGDEKE